MRAQRVILLYQSRPRVRLSVRLSHADTVAKRMEVSHFFEILLATSF